MTEILYFDINSGISGDMTIAALLDLGVDQQKFLDELAKLNLSGYEIEISKVQKNGITASDFKVILENEAHPDHYHSHQDEKDHLHSSKEDYNLNHSHQDGCTGCGNHDHNHHDHSHHNHEHHDHDSHNHKGLGDESQNHDHHEEKHSHEGQGSGSEKSEHREAKTHLHRNFNDIKNLINKSTLNKRVKNLSIEMFSEVAKAEAKVHDKDIEEVHFHEVGAVDSIIDIVGTAVLIDMINPEQIYSSPLSLGSGFVDAAHGRIPVPAPATIEILKGVPVYAAGVRSELVTPTGAAIIKTLAQEFIDLPEMKIEDIAYGAGKKDLEATNLLRIFSGSSVKKKVLKI